MKLVLVIIHRSMAKSEPLGPLYEKQEGHLKKKWQGTSQPGWFGDDAQLTEAADHHHAHQHEGQNYRAPVVIETRHLLPKSKQTEGYCALWELLHSSKTAPT